MPGRVRTSGFLGGSGSWPVLRGVLPVRRDRVPAEVLAGFTLAAVGVPEVLGYAKIAGMPLVTGLYTLLLPMAAFAVIGSSRHLVVAADSATAAILAAAVTGLAAVGSAQYARLAGLAALLTGAMLLAARLARLGFLANFLSRTVLVGFLTGVGRGGADRAGGPPGTPSPRWRARRRRCSSSSWRRARPPRAPTRPSTTRRTARTPT